jgi:ketosteroid isomerase-like protein
MDTKETVQSYFKNLYGGELESLLADDILFISNGKTSPRGKGLYAAATKRFMQTAKSVEVKKLFVEGDNACAITAYTLRSPKGNSSVCDVAEIFSVENGKIQSNSIFFDMLAFREFLASS